MCFADANGGAFMQVLDEDAQRVSEVTGLKLSMAGDVVSPAVEVIRLWPEREGTLG